MMPKEKEKDYDGYELKTIYENMEMELVYSFYRNLIKHKKDETQAGFSWEMWQVAMLRNIEKYRKENQRIIGEHRSEVKEAISKVLKHAYNKGKQNVEQMAKQAQIKLDKGTISLPENNKNTGEVNKIPPQEKSFFGVNKRKLEAMIKTVKSDMERADQAVHRKMGDVYRQTIYNAKIQLSNGAISLDKAIDIATEDFLSKGINSIAYKDKDGNILRYVNIAAYAEMVLRTAQHRARLLGEGAKRDEMGRHLIFVSSHGNCCKLCFPWQGEVLIDDVYSHPSKEYMDKHKGKYKLLSEAIMAGLLHPNCRHTLATYFEGITRLPQVHDKKEALTNYENEQKQRRLENKIRRAKRMLIGCVDDENKAKAKQHLMQCQKELRDFLKEHPEFKRHSHREKIYLDNNMVKNKVNGDKIDISNDKGDEMLEYKSIGKLDKMNIQDEFGEVQTQDVILTSEREQHIVERHSNDYNSFKLYCKSCVESPDIIIKDTKHINSIFMVKKTDEHNLNILIRLSVIGDNPDYKNSIITAYRLNDAKVERLIEKHKMLYKKE